MIQLYGYWRSTAAYRVRIALALKNVPYQNHSVHLIKDGGEQHSEAYQQLNPHQLVPTLVEDGMAISQSMAIIEYLDDKFPDYRLIFGTPQQRAQMRSMALAIACDIHPLNNLRVLQYLKNSLGQEQLKVDEWYHHWIHQGFNAIEKQLKQSAGKYCFGDEVSIADVFLIPQVYNATRFNVNIHRYPNIIRVHDNCLKLEEFQNAAPENQPDAVH